MRPADHRPAHGGYPTGLGEGADLARAWHDAHRAARALAAAQFPEAVGMIDLTPTALGRFIVVPLLVVERLERAGLVERVAVPGRYRGTQSKTRYWRPTR